MTESVIKDPSTYAKLPAGTRMLFGPLGQPYSTFKLLKDADQVGATGEKGGFIQCTRLIDKVHKSIADMKDGPEKEFVFLDDPNDTNMQEFLTLAESDSGVSVRLEFPNKRFAQMEIVLSGWEMQELDKSKPMYVVVAGKQNKIVRGIMETPVITVDPQDVSVAAGGDATFTADATDSVSQKWQEIETGSWTDISGKTEKTLTLSSVASGDNGKKVRCVFTNAHGDNVTNAATLTVL